MTSPKKIDDGGAAFPGMNLRCVKYDGTPVWDIPFQGMTLRDWLAGQALIGFVGAYNCSDEPIAESCAKAAELAYMLSDAMLAERSKEGGG